MELHADLSRRAMVHGAEVEWIASPLPGVERRMLERDGGEVARATSLVRYAPGSSFSEHVHGEGEEFLVLEGTFADDSGKYPAGTYVRNPPASRHAPWSEEGCVLLVKLRQMSAAESERVVVDTRDVAWQPGPGTGVEQIPLFSGFGEEVRLLRLGAGAAMKVEPKPGGVELFVLDGEATVGEEALVGWTWLREPAGIRSPLRSRDGCTLYLKEGHLPPPAQ